MREKIIQLDLSTKKTLKVNRILIESIIAILLLVWLHTSISKLLDFNGLKIQMAQSPVFYKTPILASIAGPGLELLASVLLLFKRARMLGMILSFLLMIFFTWYVWYIMIKMPSLPCTCGGVVSWLNWPQHLSLNIFLAVLSLIGIILLRRHKKILRKESN